MPRHFEVAFVYSFKGTQASTTFNQFAWAGALNNQNISAKTRYLMNKKCGKPMQFELGLYLQRFSQESSIYRNLPASERIITKPNTHHVAQLYHLPEALYLLNNPIISIRISTKRRLGHLERISMVSVRKNPVNTPNIHQTRRFCREYTNAASIS